MTTKTGSIIRSVPQPPGANRRTREERELGGYLDQLRRYRESAKGWLGIQAAILGLISIVGTLNTEQGLDTLNTPLRWVAIAGMLLALAAATIGIALLGSEAWPFHRFKPRRGLQTGASALAAAKRTYQRATAGIVSTFAAVLLLAIAVMVTWIPADQTSPGQLVRVTTATGSHCGELLDSDSSTIAVAIAGQTISTPAGDIVALAPVDVCTATDES